MSKENQDRIINNIVKMIKERYENKKSRIPEDWDGFELSQYVADITAENAPSKRTSEAWTNKRSEEYKNTYLTQNL